MGMSAGNRILVLGGSGVVGSALIKQLSTAPGLSVDVVARRPKPFVTITGDILDAHFQKELAGRFDVVVNLIASTRWTMADAEAWRSNVDSAAAAAFVASGGHLVHTSTSFLGKRPFGEAGTRSEFRNSYEWSKAHSEATVLGCDSRASIVRIPQMIGNRSTGEIERYEGVYSVARGIASGLLPVAVGTSDAILDLCPCDDAADLIARTAFGDRGARCTLSSGDTGVTLASFVRSVVNAVNRLRRLAGVDELPLPPVVPRERWDRLFWPLAEDVLGNLERRAIELLMEFAAYTDSYHGGAPTHVVQEPQAVLDRSLDRWADDNVDRICRPYREWSAR